VNKNNSTYNKIDKFITKDYKEINIDTKIQIVNKLLFENENKKL
jgi:hypothetical protein